MTDSKGAARAHSGSAFVRMVKKRLANGEPCRKCAQAEEMLRRRELWEQIDEVVVADEAAPESLGMRLAREHGVQVAPFFVVEEAGETRVFDSAIQVAREVLKPKKEQTSRPGVQHVAEANTSASNEMSLDEDAALALARTVEGAPPQVILDAVLQLLGRRATIAFSGAEDVVLIDIASRTGLPFSVFCLDTGRLHAETYQFIERVRKHYALEIDMLSPDPVHLEPLVRKKGLFSFYQDGHQECCGVRKIEPLSRALVGKSAWMTGQRKDQSVTRTSVSVVHSDDVHGTPDARLVKLNPLANWTSAQVWQYIRDNEIPYNQLHDRGFVSIGCEPCTRELRPGEHERAARWWWEESTQRECGLHVAKVGASQR